MVDVGEKVLVEPLLVLLFPDDTVALKPETSNVV
jgi:hypothetical protein